ncbi:MurR/RpiR family transcriptional regulator [Microbacterium sp. C5A9]|uniref:MurR/RpiR family transcriptional regulator n=1 Tax=Microbacterium sp. C5A9 TaxID=2736663 RepID=UPI001F5229F3|nr:MurR/RpiR family transcriptional regulator [Microbacterium sp. C5A9]MCI1017612.1 MurR/RpiR family transcriptional regulator [Microbacterium sp. C5A9]
MSIQTTIAAVTDVLPPSLARIARVVARTPSIVVDSTITELASTCQTSVASVIRFCRAIGVDGYAALRMAVAAELGRESAQFGAPAGFGSEISAADSLRQATAKVAALELLAIEETVAALDYEALARAVDAVDIADRIVLFGVGASGLAAADLGQKLLRIGRLAVVASDSHEATAVAALGTTRSVAIGLSHSGTTRETVTFLQTARSAASITIAITGAASSPLVAQADHALLTHAREPRLRAGAMVSRIAQLAVVDCLFVGIGQRRHDATIDALQRTSEATQPLHAPGGTDAD